MRNRSLAARLTLLGALLVTLGYLAYAQGFLGRLGGEPAALDFAYTREADWLAGEVVLDLAESVAYAATGDPDVARSTSLDLQGADDGSYAVELAFPGSAGVLVYELALPRGVWEPEAYVPLVHRLLETHGLRPPGRHAPPDDDLLETLLNLRASTLEAENSRISERLAASPLDATAHEAAALLVGAFALREAAGVFNDPRVALNRLTSHLALAMAVREDRSLGTSGALARIVLLTMESRGGEALERLARLAGEDEAPSVAVWERALRLRLTQDWRSIGSPRDASLLERLEYYRARLETNRVEAVLHELDALDPEPIPDWGRIGISIRLSVPLGHRFIWPGIGLELEELVTVWELGRSDPAPERVAEALNAPVDRFIGPEGPRVLSWGMWAAFVQRHVVEHIQRADHFIRRMYGDNDGADEYKSAMRDRFGDLALFPVTSTKLMYGQNEGEWDSGDLVPALRLAVRRPDLITHDNWQHLDEFARYEPVPFGMPTAQAWFVRPSAERAPYEGWSRWRRTGHLVSHDELDALRREWPQSYNLAGEYFNATYRKDDEWRIDLFGARVEYDLRARQYLEASLDDDPDARAAAMMRSCELAADRCIDLGHFLLGLDREADAAAAYQRAFDDPTVDPVVKSNTMLWLVQYYHRSDQVPRALAVAGFAADVGSGSGLLTRAWLREALGRYDEAEEDFLTVAERYPGADEPVIGFYYRMAEVRQDVTFREPLEAWLPKVFPAGLQPLTPELAGRIPETGVVIMSDSELARDKGLRIQDVIIGLDGWRVETLDQYRTVGYFSETAPARLNVWRPGAEAFEVTVEREDFWLGVEMRSFPLSGWSG